jgi:tetratricopeptide (TPR) repeat protein
MAQEQGGNDLAALLTKAVTALQSGNPKQAGRLATKALKRAPNNPTCHLIVATVHHNLERPQDAEKHYVKCLSIEPGNLRALTNLGMLQLNAERTEEAIVHLERALNIDATALEARHYLARAYGMCGRYKDAIDQFELVSKQAPNVPEVLTGLGKALREAERVDEAIAVLKRADELSPNDKQILRALGMNYAALGDFDEAEKWLRDLIRIAPFETDAYLQLSLIKRFSADDVREVQLRLDETDAGTDANRAAFLYAVGGFYDANKDTSRAFKSISAANDIMDQHSEFDWPRVSAHYHRMTLATDARALASRAHGNVSDKPIFIVGMPRSGTTLIEQILAGHPDVYAGGERTTIAETANALKQGTTAEALSVDEFSTAELQLLAQHYLDQLPDSAGKALRVTDKLPGNVAYLPIISCMFPNARFILCRRHPMDVAWSIYKNSFSEQLAYATSLDAIAQSQQLIFGYMDVWMEQMQARSLEVLYENVVTDFEANARRIVEFAGLPWDDACLNTSSVDRAVRTASLWQVRQPVFNSSVAQWRRYEAQLAGTAAKMAPLIEAYESKLAAPAS